MHKTYYLCLPLKAACHSSRSYSSAFVLDGFSLSQHTAVLRTLKQMMMEIACVPISTITLQAMP